MTYRAVGSSTGQAEFLGVNNTDPNSGVTDPWQHIPHVDFGAGDIPVPSEQYDRLNAIGTNDDIQMVHLPFALSSVSFFYNINGVEEVDLTGCLLGKIFNREITNWSDPELVALNPELATKDVDITVCRRTHGSSSTKSITKYLNKKCSASWPSDMVGSELDNWDKGTTKVQGSGGMATCISENNGAIGYLESGHGWAENLSEVSLENKEGNYVTSQNAFKNGGIKSAASDADTPPSAMDDWSSVDFIDKGGENTFPIVLMSYVYVRTNVQKYMQDEKARGLLKLFLESLYMEEYFGKCSKLAFSTPPISIRETAQAGINEINWDFSSYNDENMWKFEIDTKKYVGADEYVISSKRQSYQGVAIDDILSMEAETLMEIRELYQLAEMQLGYNIFNDHEKGQIDVAVVLSAISFALWCAFFVGWIVKKFVFNM